jgi:pyridoxamine 5'-phosphate oxidase
VTLSGDLQAVLADAMRLLARAVTDRRGAMHTPTIATVGLDGRPRLRTVVLRGFEPARREFRFHTDVRSPKVAEIARDTRVAAHVHEPGSKVQIRLEATATLHGDDAIADAAWLASQPLSRTCYAAQPGPGVPIGEGGAFTLPATSAEVEAGRRHFVAVVARIDSLDWLHLAHAGHRRALFRWSGDACEGHWLAP